MESSIRLELATLPTRHSDLGQEILKRFGTAAVLRLGRDPVLVPPLQKLRAITIDSHRRGALPLTRNIKSRGAVEEEQGVYRANGCGSAFGIAVAAVFVAVGLHTAISTGEFYPGIIILVPSAWALVAVCAHHQTRIIVDETGITISPPAYWPLTRLAVPWESIEAWSVTPMPNDDSFTSQGAHFKVRGLRWELTIRDSEAWWPSFDAFLADVRSRAGEKEVVTDFPGGDR